MIFKGVIIIAAIVFGIVLIAVLNLYNVEDSDDSITEITESDLQKIIDITEQFIITGPTYSYDGITNTLEIVVVSEDISDSKFLLTGTFKTLHTGYGNRVQMDLPVDITFHVIEVVIVDEKIISAVIDNQWDELNQITCNTGQC
ncbi:MAG: hypothetical protein ACW9W3_06590 [Candidatus Nitrosopumilus sp. bin_68KS]